MADYSEIGTYNVDVCLCIDKTGSMGPIIDTVKTNALNLYHDVMEELEQKQKHVNQFRIRVIWFGDYLADSTPILVSDFLNMPDDVAQFEKFVKSVKPSGGGDAPEDGLEALAYAIRSDWVKTGWKKRHIIAVFTDAPTHELGFGKKAATYPKSGMPADFAELTQMWGGGQFPGEMDNNAKRLLLFAPNTSFWDTISKSWNNVALAPVEEAKGLHDVSYQYMINMIGNSV